MGLNKHELTTIVDAGLSKVSVALKRSHDNFWYAIITLESNGTEHEILTARRSVKTWRDLADAVLFIQDIFPNCDTVSIDIGKWELVRKARK